MSEKQVNEEMKQQAQSVTASAPSAEMMDDVQEIMKKYDRESNTREWIGVPGKIVRYLLAAFSLLMVYMNLIANWDERVRRAAFLGTIIVFAFVMYPIRKGRPGKPNHIPWYDLILMIAGAVVLVILLMRRRKKNNTGCQQKNEHMPDGSCVSAGKTPENVPVGTVRADDTELKQKTPTDVHRVDEI